MMYTCIIVVGVYFVPTACCCVMMVYVLYLFHDDPAVYTFYFCDQQFAMHTYAARTQHPPRRDYSFVHLNRMSLPCDTQELFETYLSQESYYLSLLQVKMTVMRKISNFFRKDECKKHYKFGTTLGSGSFATVYKATHLKDDSESGQSIEKKAY